MSKPVRLGLLCWEEDWQGLTREGQEEDRSLWMTSTSLNIAWLTIDMQTHWNVEEQEKGLTMIDIGLINRYQR